jgi:transposase
MQVADRGKIYLRCGYTDMRKGAQSLSILSSDILSESPEISVVVVYRGKRSDKIKILWWDGQGYCLMSKGLESGKFPWYRGDSEGYIRVTGGQLSMLMEGIDWRNPRWSSAPIYSV